MSCVSIQLQRVWLVASKAGALAAPGVQRCRGRSTVGHLLISLRYEVLRVFEGAAEDTFGRRLGFAAIARGGSRGLAPQLDGHCCKLWHLHCPGALA
eukprot:1245891-Pleurochrysis_carterae.AAC.1